MLFAVATEVPQQSTFCGFKALKSVYVSKDKVLNFHGT